jgi:NADPH-dependent 2,4-dienoyl-CoA reductase/sulfur reductase-like enzyme
MKTTEVLVLGAGPGGIAAATAAARNGCKVILVDDNISAGGQIWRGGVSAPKETIDPAKRSALEALQASGAELLYGWRLFDASASGHLSCIREGDGTNEVRTLRYDRLILATGARERFLPFPGWTLPGVFGAGGLQALVKGGLSVAGKRVVVAGSGPLLLAVAAHLAQFGAKVVSVAEQASFGQLVPFASSLWSHPGKLLQGARYRAAIAGTPYRTGCWPLAALGKESLTAVRLTNGKKTWEEPCDFLACGFHLVPNTEVAALLGCVFRDDFVQTDEMQRTSLPNVYCVGEPTGIGGLDAALIQGEIAGLACSDKTTEALALAPRRAKEQAFASRLESAFRLRPEVCKLAAADTIVCRCEDVPYSTLALHSSWTDAKLQTRCGMGPCQGRICGPAVETLFGWRLASVRPPLFPVPVHAFCTAQSSLLTQTEQPKETL